MVVDVDGVPLPLWVELCDAVALDVCDRDGERLCDGVCAPEELGDWDADSDCVSEELDDPDAVTLCVVLDNCVGDGVVLSDGVNVVVGEPVGLADVDAVPETLGVREALGSTECD